MGEKDETDLRARVERRIKELTEAFGPFSHAGRGIVIAAGGARLFVNAYVLVHLLRRTLGCQTPIEVWHYGDDELSPRMRALLAELGVATVDASPLADKAGVTIRDGWQLKPFMLAACRFAEVLLLDADQTPIVDPSVVFDWPQYRETGAVFWPDILDVSSENPIWAALGFVGERSVSLESGQLVVDKRRHMRAALATLALNEAAETVYRYVYGDKDTFLLGWRLVDAPFVVVPHRPFIEERSLIQRDFDGAALLQHRTNCKWTYSGEQYAFKAAVHHEACLAALAELRTVWNGRVFNPPARDARARRVEAWLMGALRLRCEIAGEDSFSIEFWPDGELGEGRSFDRANWSVESDPSSDSGFVLTIWGANGRPAYRLGRDPDGVFRGERLRFPAAPAAGILEPIAVPRPPASSDRRSLVDDFLAAANFDGEGEDAGLSAALRLLSRIEGDVAERLRALAREESDPQRAARLEALAAAVGDAHRPAMAGVVRDFPRVEDGYIRVPEFPAGGEPIG